MSHHDYTTGDELRRATRFVEERGADAAVILTPDGELLVDVHDESLGGLGLYLADSEYFVVGREVDIIYAGAMFRARVRHVEPQEDGGYIAGFEVRTCRDVPG